MNLSDYPITTAQAAVKSACLRNAAGELTDAQLAETAKAVLADSRSSLAVALALALPLPAELPPAPEAAKRSSLLLDLPGLAFAARAAPEEALAIVEDEVTLVAQRCPLWWAVVTHPSPDVRLAAVSRLPATGSPLSVWLPLLCSDNDKHVRHKARDLLGMPIKKTATNWRDYQRGIMSVDACIADVATAEGDRLSMHLRDPRMRVRFAAAMRLPKDTLQWEIFAGDVSPRLRRLAAEHVPLGTTAADALLKDANPHVQSVIAIRAWEAYDAAVAQAQPAAKPPGKRPVRAERKHIAAWKKRLEAGSASEEET